MYKSLFLNELYEFMMARRYSKRTIKTYIFWIRSFILFCDKKHPSELETTDVECFLTHLAVNRMVASSTQSLALNALAFLYNTFFEQPLGDLKAFKRSKRQAKLPTILTQDEVNEVIKKAGKLAGIRKTISSHSFATHLLQNGADISHGSATARSC
jgi:site-specific recombinase XerD